MCLITRLILSFVLFGSLLTVLLQLEVEPERIEIAEDGVILHYNSPAAIKTEFGITFGWQSQDGSILVATSDGIGVPKPETVHRFDSPDDHAAPAIIRMPKGKHAGQFFLATAHHSSDLYIYRSNEKRPSGFIRSCAIKGRYTYPRFVTAGGKTLLFVRTEFEESSKPTEYRGALGVLDVTKDDCSIPKVVAFPEFREFIYAVTPVADGNAVNLAWTIYDGHNRAHTLSYTGEYDPIANKLVTAPMAIPKDMGEAVVWSVASSGDTVAVSHFADIFKPMSGQVNSALYRPGERYSRPISDMAHGIGPYYQFGKVLHPVKREFLEAVTTKETTDLKRHSYGLGWPWIKSCSTKGHALSPQYVSGSTSYVFIETEEEYKSKEPFKTRLVLCKTRTWLQGTMNH